MTVVNQDGRTGLSPVAHPIRVGSDSPPLDDEALAIVLAEGIVDEVSFEGESLGYFEVSNGEVTVFARFHENRDDDSAPELAAYRLDRMLGLGMIPVTARREVEGKRGALQLYQRTVELVGMMANMGAPCSFDKQVSAMRVFDALIGNSSRMQSSILFDPEDMLLMLVDHSSAFGNGENQPGHSMHTGLTVGKQWQIALRSLDDETLQAALGDVLGEQQLKALEQRRDALLDSPIARRSD
jgi:hypothetical protein